MKLTLKTLQQKQFVLNAELSETILDVKKKIAEDQQFAVENQKLIFSGKILSDDKTVESLNFKEGKDFIVVMVSKPKAAPAAPAASASTSASVPVPAAQTAAVTETPAAPSAPAAAPPTEAAPADAAATTDNTASTEVSATPAAAVSNDPAFVTGSALQSAVNEMMAMGFEREQVMRALRAAYNNPDRAIEYLMDGIPEHLLSQGPPQGGPEAGNNASAVAQTPQQQSQQPSTPAAPARAPQNLFAAAQQAAQQGQTGGPATPTGAGRGAGGDAAEIERIRNDPMMGQLRQLVQSNPALLQPFLESLAASNRDLFNLISRNQQAFMQFLTEGSDVELGAMDEDDEEGGHQGGGVPIQVTEAERDAIERLQGMGFPRDIVLQAYFACDKNEELAANFLLESGSDLMNDFEQGQ